MIISTPLTCLVVIKDGIGKNVLQETGVPTSIVGAPTRSVKRAASPMIIVAAPATVVALYSRYEWRYCRVVTLEVVLAAQQRWQ